MIRVCLAILISLICFQFTAHANTEFEGSYDKITLVIRNVIERDALAFTSNGDKAVVLIPQSGLDAMSWVSFATQLQHQNIASVSLNTTSSEDIEAAITYLSARGKKQITLIGGSIGGGSAQKVMTSANTEIVNKIILLGSARGDMSDVTGADKLFIVADTDLFVPDTYTSFQRASAPKKLSIYVGNAHGQEIFKTDQSEMLSAEMMHFILKD